MSFAIDGTAIWLILAFILFFLFRVRRFRKRPQPRLYFSRLKDLQQSAATWRLKHSDFAKRLYVFSLLFFLLAFLDPRMEVTHTPSGKQAAGKAKKIATEGIAIYLVLDQSGSMASQVVTNPTASTVAMPSKIELLKQVTRDFIEGNPELDLKGRDSDLIGLVTFARTAHIISPLTLDHDTILNELARLDVVKDPTQDGTAIGYAIYKTANSIAATKAFAAELAKEHKGSYALKGTAIVLVTDGFQSPNPDDKGNRWRTMGIEEAAQFAKSQGIHLYIVNIEPSIEDDEYAPQRRLMTRAAESTGGKFYAVSDPNKLHAIYADIDRLEKSVIPDEQFLDPTKMAHKTAPKPLRYLSFYPYLLSLGLILLFLGFLTETRWMRSIP